MPAKARVSICLLGLMAVLSPVSSEARQVAADQGNDDGNTVPLDQVPAAVKHAAVAAVPGLVLDRASRETENGLTIYELEGTAEGRRVEVEVSAEGKVIEIEKKGE